MSSELGLSDHHQKQTVNFLRFARHQRHQRLKAVDANFDDVTRSQLNESTYTQEEVFSLLDQLHGVVRSDVEEELLNASHTTALLLRQLLQQAEKWHLKMSADISELQNRELLEQVKEFEEMEFSGRRGGNFSKLSSRLQPLNDTGATNLLQRRIEEIEEENEMLRREVDHLRDQTGSLSKERGALASELHSARGARQMSSRNDDEVEEMRRRMGDMQTDMDRRMREQSSRGDAVHQDLTSTKHELLRVQDMLEMAEKELEKKVSQTAPFRNLKQMLMKKNDQLKHLRTRLSRYEDVQD